MNFNSNTILFILVGLVAIAVIAIGFYIYKMDFSEGKTLYSLNKRVEILEKKLYMNESLEKEEETIVNTSVPREEHFMPSVNIKREMVSPLDFLMKNVSMVGGESQEEIAKEIEELRKQIEQASQKSETIEIMSDSQSKLSDIREDSNENVESNESINIINSNESIATNGQKTEESIELLHEFDDLGDTDHIENSELDSYINNAALENSEDIEKKLDEMSNSSQVDVDVQYNVRIELIANSSKLKDIKDLCKKNGIAIGNASKTDLVRKLYKINPNIYDLLVTNKENHTKENSNLN